MDEDQLEMDFEEAEERQLDLFDIMNGANQMGEWHDD